MIGKIWQWLDPRGRGRFRALVRIGLFWNPAACAIFALVLGGADGFLRSFAFSITVGTIALLVSFTMVRAIAALEARVLRLRGLPPVERGIGWNMVVAGLSLPAGVFMGLALIAWSQQEELPNLRNVFIGVVVGTGALLVFSLAETVSALKNVRHQAELNQRAAENARLRAQLAALTAQMNPHLLFNTLNTIASLAQTDADATERTTVELASLYRGVLNASRREQHSLADELDICRAYLAIESARFGSRLKHRIDVDTDASPAGIMVPPLLLQPLVENAVKHGIGPKKNGGTVHVLARTDGEALHLSVLDDGVGYDGGQRSSDSTGIANCEKRLALLHAGAATLKIEERASGGTEVQVRLPMVPGGEA